LFKKSFEYKESNIEQNKFCLRFEDRNYTIIKKISFFWKIRLINSKQSELENSSD